jgi:hypothetical protein
MGVRSTTPRQHLAFALALACLTLCAALVSPSLPAAQAAYKGVIDHRLEYSNRVEPVDIPIFADELAATGATWTRVLVRWNYLQPVKPGDPVPEGIELTEDGYDAHYVAELEAVVAALHARGIRVILTGNDIPRWAANPKYCKDNHVTSAVIKAGDAKVMAAFQKFGRFCASNFLEWDVKHFEVWNEPNLASGIYPQIVGKTAMGPSAYVKMLKAFYTGAKQANRGAVVIAGATSRFGSNGTSPSSTSPQWFARYLKAQRANRWFNAYSHHPYTKLGSNPVPSVPPRQPTRAVTLGNIDTLLKIFPGKPFYLTEFCYSTPEWGEDLFCVAVTKANQARYLRQAWAFVAKHRQIKVMLWFLVRDYVKDPVLHVGVFTGLTDFAGLRKPAWYAFVGHTTLTAAASQPSAAAGVPFTVSGVLTTRDGAGEGVTVLLQRRTLTGGKWSTVAKPATVTDADGAYSFDVTQTVGWRYRVVWDGVCESAPVTVSIN